MGGRDRSDSEEEIDRKHRKRDKKSSRKRSRSHKREDDEDSDSGSDSSERDRKSKKRRHDRDRKHRRRHASSSEDSGSSSSEPSDADDSVDSRRRRKKDSKKRRRKDDKKKKKKSSKHEKKKSSKRRKRDGDEKKHKKKSRSDADEDDGQLKALARNYALADALHQLLLEHPTPAMAKDTLPLVLMKLGGGTSLDLRQMPDRSAAEGIQSVFRTLQSFGVGEEEPGVWKLTVPGGRADERLLLRIVRSLLDEIGITMDAIAKKDQATSTVEDAGTNESTEDSTDAGFDKIKDQTVKILQSFRQKNKEQEAFTLPGELGGLCKMLLEGENVALDGLPDGNLRESLEGLFQQCGLELQEMEEESDSEDEAEQDDNERAMGFGLPESEEQGKMVQTRLLSVMKACETVASAPASDPAVVRKGPMPMPEGYTAPEESSDEEGPAPVGAAKRKEPPPVSKEVIKHQAEMRARQLKGAVTGQEALLSSDPNTREEWMLVPGKFDFLSNIKAGNPMKSRNFQGKSKGGGGAEAGPRVMDPKIKAEMDAIMQAHHDARGPTLVEQHRRKLKQEKEAKAKDGKGGQWKWSRDKDLDSGRRVDKDALHQVLGGAVEDLKKKFQGGF